MTRQHNSGFVADSEADLVGRAVVSAAASDVLAQVGSVGLVEADSDEAVLGAAVLPAAVSGVAGSEVVDSGRFVDSVFVASAVSVAPGSTRWRSAVAVLVAEASADSIEARGSATLDSVPAAASLDSTQDSVLSS